MYKLGTQLFLMSIAFLFLAQPHAKAQVHSETPAQHEDHAHYSESALRRFEIITLSSLPFTAIHSYVAVRGFKMYRENIFAPEMTPRDYRIVGIGAVSLSLFIGVWDWLHTRNVDRSAPLVPEPEAPPVEEEEPVEGTIARLSKTNPYAAKYKEILRQDALNNRLNRWANDPAIGFAVPLLQVRF